MIENINSLSAHEWEGGLGYARYEVERTWKNDGPRFAIPLEQIEAVFKAAKQEFNREAFAKTIAIRKGYNGFEPVDVLNDGVVKVTISTNSGLYYRTGKKDEEIKKVQKEVYKVEGKMFTGPALSYYGRVLEGVSLVVTVAPVESPTKNENVVKRVRKIGHDIEEAWRPLTPYNTTSEISKPVLS